MKKSLLTISLIISATAIITLCSWDYAPLEPTSHNSTNITADDDWILIGEVTLSNYNNSSETIKANLYAREIAKNLIYRVEYQGSYYATRWHDNSQTYHITINGKTYKCDVPVMSNGSSSDNKTGLQRYVGVWKSTAKELSTGKLFTLYFKNDTGCGVNRQAAHLTFSRHMVGDDDFHFLTLTGDIDIKVAAESTDMAYRHVFPSLG